MGGMLLLGWSSGRDSLPEKERKMNKAIISGRLTRDPELSYLEKDNTAICKFTIAVNRRYNKDEADFIPVVAWRKTAEFCARYLGKGCRAEVAGSIQTRSWDTNNGRRYATEIVADEVNPIDWVSDAAEPANNTDEPDDDFVDDSGDGLPF